MSSLTNRKSLFILFALACILAFSTSQAICEEPKPEPATAETPEQPPEKLEVSGKRYNVETSRKMIKIEDVEGHYVGISETVGVDVKSGHQTFTTSVSDTIMGNGSMYGYYKIVMPDGGVCFGKAEGKITTVLSPNGKPITTAEGTWTMPEMIMADKIYEGSGTFYSRVIGPGVSSMQYEGELRQKK